VVTVGSAVRVRRRKPQRHRQGPPRPGGQLQECLGRPAAV